MAGRPLADAFVRVHPDTKGFATETEAQTSGLSSAMSGLGKVIAGVFAAETIVDWGKKSVEAFLSAEQSQHKLEDAFARFPALSDTNVKALEDLDAALGKKTTFDRYAIESGQAVLAQFHLTGTQLTELTPLLLDYAAKTGKDLPDAAGVLGKALLGQGRGLKDVGIQFTNTGSATGNYTELVGALRTQVGGFAEEEGKTAEGQLKIMENRFHDLAVTVGSVIVPVMSELIGVVIDVIDVISATVGWLDHNRAATAAFAAALGTLLIPNLVALISDVTDFIATQLQEAFEGAAEGAKALASGAGLANLAMLPLAIAAAAIGYAVVKSWQGQKAALDAGKKSADDYANSLVRSSVSVDTMQVATSQLTAKFNQQIATTGALIQKGDIVSNSFFKQLGALKEYSDQLDTQKAKQTAIANNQLALSRAFHLTTAQVETLAAVNNIDLTGSLDGVTTAFKKAYTATAATHHPLSAAQADFKKVSDNALSATDQVNALRDAFDLLVGKGLSADEATITFSNDLADLNGKLKASHHSMSLTTQAGRDAREQFDRTAQAALDLATAQKDAGYSTDTIKKSLDKSIAALEKAGGSNAYVRSEVAKLKAAEDGLNSSVKNVNTSLSQVPQNPYGGVKLPGTSGPAGTGKFSATGGLVTGPGTKTSDSVLMHLSAGEFVMQASAVDKLGLPVLRALNAGLNLPRLPAAGTATPAVTATVTTPAPRDDITPGEQQMIGLLRQLVQAAAVVGPANFAAALDGTARASVHAARGTTPVFG